MSDDFDVLRAAWTADPGLEVEVGTSRRLWRRAVRRMWFWNVVDAAVLLALTVHFALSIMGNGSWLAALVAALTVAILLWTLRRRYLLRGAEIADPDAERVSVLGAAIRQAQARVMRNALSLAIIVPMFALGVIFGQLQKNAEGAGGPRDASGPAWLDHPLVEWGAVAILVLVVAKLVQALYRDRRALVHLRQRVEEYRAEYERDANPLG
ncbi:MAG TPA: hypothetical protein VEZ20_09300 [Allosphingosinicella sp.]|jgi:hypothetical protein|nr:hypothetical protein [Allosphingosinicella sp.]